MDTLSVENGAIRWRYNGEWLTISAHGADGLRLRASNQRETDPVPGALLPSDRAQAQVAREDNIARIRNGRISAEVDLQGRVRFLNAAGHILLEEKWRQRDTVTKFWTVGIHEPRTISALSISGREFKPLMGGVSKITVRFEPNPGERLYGMGQYQQSNLDLAGCTLELAQRNSQASVPFVLSSRGYGFLWNNPAIGEASFAANGTRWTSEAARGIDYWITAGDSPAAILRNYAAVTGRVPMMPENLLGLWQCKLRYRTQDELLTVARGYAERGIPLSVIVADFFHWPIQGDWRFDAREWPDPAAMTAELGERGTSLMVSVWPTVDHRSENHLTLAERGLLVQTKRGLNVQLDFLGNTRFIDVTNPMARQFLWDTARRNYYENGVRLFWLDEAEPEYAVYDFDAYRYHTGDVLETGNAYPLHYAQAFHEGLTAAGEERVVSLVRCAWAGSQRYGALVWSGDIHSSFEAMRNQLSAGLNMGLAGIPWWTTDVGGFHGGHVEDEHFRELLVRWFQWAVFSPILRMHGYRDPVTPAAVPYRDGIAQCDTGADNELWSFGPEIYDILRRYVELRLRLKPYLVALMTEAHRSGDPLMRTVFYEFPEDATAWEVDDQYMFGPDVLVAPVMARGLTARSVYLPVGTDWIDPWSGIRHGGGRRVSAACPIDRIPVFVRAGSDVLDLF